MAPAGKAEKKAAADAAAWMFNVVTSVGVIIVNKALMATYGFSFGKLPFRFLNYVSVIGLICLFPGSKRSCFSINLLSFFETSFLYCMQLQH